MTEELLTDYEKFKVRNGGELEGLGEEYIGEEEDLEEDVQADTVDDIDEDDIEDEKDVEEDSPGEEVPFKDLSESPYILGSVSTDKESFMESVMAKFRTDKAKAKAEAATLDQNITTTIVAASAVFLIGWWLTKRR
jgi:hypothetical protein